MSELNQLSLADALDGLAKKSFSSVELTDAFIAAIEKANPQLNAYVLPTADKARAMAKDSDVRRAKGQASLLEGAPLGIKDLFCTEGVRTTACSKILGDFTPTYESTVTSHLWRDGAVMLGKLNLDEFAMGSSNETSAYGNVISPWRRASSNTPNKSESWRVIETIKAPSPALPQSRRWRTSTR
jgi:aspartyl-tRNA(Asn)/glutamyl-tRNA(Gln) amidotransferase subunit A